MAIDFDAEVDKLHKAVDDTFGKDAVFEPVSGVKVEGLRVERFLPEVELGGERARTAIEEARLVVRASKLPERPKKDDVFVVTMKPGEIVRWRVIGKPVKADDDGLLYDIKVERV